MPKQNPFGKIGDSSPPESPTKKSNEPEPERTLLVKHDVCVYRIPPQVQVHVDEVVDLKNLYQILNDKYEQASSFSLSNFINIRKFTIIIFATIIHHHHHLSH